MSGLNLQTKTHNSSSTQAAGTMLLDLTDAPAPSPPQSLTIRISPKGCEVSQSSKGLFCGVRAHFFFFFFFFSPMVTACELQSKVSSKRLRLPQRLLFFFQMTVSASLSNLINCFCFLRIVASLKDEYFSALPGRTNIWPS